MPAITPVVPPRRVPKPATVPAHAQVQKSHGVQSNQRFQPLLAPTGPYPYRMQLGDVLAAGGVSAIQSAGKLMLHVVGDTGGVKNPQPQQTVADQLAQDPVAGGDGPALFYPRRAISTLHRPAWGHFP